MPSTYSNLNCVLKSGTELEAISVTNLYLSCPREEMQKSFHKRSTSCRQCRNSWGRGLGARIWNCRGIYPQDQAQYFPQVYFISLHSIYMYYPKHPRSIMFLTVSGKSVHKVLYWENGWNIIISNDYNQAIFAMIVYFFPLLTLAPTSQAISILQERT